MKKYSFLLYTSQVTHVKAAQIPVNQAMRESASCQHHLHNPTIQVAGFYQKELHCPIRSGWKPRTEYSLALILKDPSDC